MTAVTMIRRRGMRVSRRRAPVALALVGILLCLAVLVIAFLGPLLAPHSPTETITRAYAPAGESGLLLGSDYLGRDVLSRVLWGGRSIIILPVLATCASYAVGGTVGLTAAFIRGIWGEAAMRLMDVVLVFPALLLLLVLVTGFGDNQGAVFLGLVLLNFPSIARVIHAAAVAVSVRGFVEAATVRGERLPYVLFKEILPNIAGTVAADAGPRFIGSVFLIAALSFLGFGLEPPTANWALMITENRTGISLNGLAVFAPICVIAMLTIGVNLVSDALARRIGSSDAGEAS